MNYLTSFLPTYAPRSLTSCVCRTSEKLYNIGISTLFSPLNYDLNDAAEEQCPWRLKTSENYICTACELFKHLSGVYTLDWVCDLS